MKRGVIHLRERGVVYLAEQGVIHLMVVVLVVVMVAVVMEGGGVRSEAAGGVAVWAAGRGRPWLNLRDGRDVAVSYRGAPGLERVMAQGLARPTALAAADFDEDGVPDLVSGYASAGGGVVTLYRGNVDALFPHSRAARARRAEGRFTAAFLSSARVFGLPGSPDFVGAGDFDNDGHRDVVAAARGGRALWLLAGDGEGRLGVARRIPLPGSVTSMTVGEINRADGLADVIVGVDGEAGPEVLVFESPEGALGGGGRYSGPGRVRPVDGPGRRRGVRPAAERPAAAIELPRPEVFPMPAEVRGLALGQLDGSFELDLAVAAGEELVIVHGRDRRLSQDEARRAEVSDAVIEELDLGFEVGAVAIGDFIWDGEHRAELAVMGEAGEVRLLARARGSEEAEKRRSRGAGEQGGEEAAMSWQLAQTVSVSDGLSLSSAEASVVLVPARLSSLPTDDLVVIDGVNRQLHILTGMGDGGAEMEQPMTPQGSRLTGQASRLTHLASLDVSSAPVAVLPMRLNRDALSDLVIVRQGSSAPAVALTVPVAVFTVTSTADDPDFDTTDGVCDTDDSAGDGPCTLRAAIEQANASMGADEIDFNIAGTGPHTIQPGLLSTSPLPDITEAVTIDGYTQSGAVVNTNPVGMGLNAVLQIELDGSSGVAHGLKLEITGGSSVVRGLVINQSLIFGIVLKSSNNRIEGNFIGTDVTGTADLGNGGGGVFIDGAPDNVVGGTASGAGNVISGNDLVGVAIFGDAGNVVQGNFIGTDVTGTADLANRVIGVSIDGPDNTVGGTASGAGNVISGNGGDGVQIIGSGAAGNVVQGNLIGTDVTGTADLGNGVDGVSIGGPDNTVGGTASGAGNVISGNDLHGVAIVGGGATGNVVQGNLIGTDVTGTADLGNSFNGVHISGASNNTIGGMAAGAGNTIAFNGGNGVELFGSAGTGNAIDPNAIHSNGGLGIDLGADGVTANDAGDGDGGANKRQNFPVLLLACDNGGRVRVDFSLDSTAGNSTYPIGVEFFRNAACDPSGNGEGEAFVGSFVAAEPGAFTVDLVGASVGDVITATATDADGNTSEFSACVEVEADTTPPEIGCPGEITVECTGPAGAVVTFATPTATDNCDPNPGVVCAPPSGSTFPLGTTTVTCTATDASGNTASCTFTVTVQDTTPPEISCPSDVTVVADGRCQAVFNAAATATDVCDPNPTIASNPPLPAVLAGPTGAGAVTHTITFTATDASGNSTGCTMTVRVVNRAPVAAAGADQEVDEGAMVTLDGTGSSDSDAGQTLTFRWEQVGGPAVVLDDPTSATPGFTAPAVGDGGCVVLVFKLTVTDPCGATAMGTVAVAVNDVLVVQDERGGDCVRLFPCSGRFVWRLSDGGMVEGVVTMSIAPGVLNFRGRGSGGEVLQGGVSLVRRTGTARLVTVRGRGLGSIVDGNIDDNGPCP